MGKVAFCFPGQGALEAGMGREIAEAVPGRDGGLPASAARRPASTSRSSASTRRSRSSSRPRCSSRHSSRRASRSSPRSAPRASSRTSSSAIRWASSRRLPSVGAMRHRRGDRSRARAWARDGRGGPPASRLDGRDPRARGRGGREPLPQDRRRLAGELQLPGPDRDLGRERRSRGVLRRGRDPRRSTSDQAEGLRCVPQPTRRPGSGPRSSPRSTRCASTTRSRRSCRP